MPYTDFPIPEHPCRQDMWDKLAEESRPIVVYGMGNGADKLIKRFEKYNIEIADFFASDGFVRGHFFHGKRVKSFSEIKTEYPDFVIVLSFASNRPEVIEMLAEIDRTYEMYVPDMPVAGEDEYFDREFFNANYGEIMRAYRALADEDSRRAYSAILNYRLSGKMSYLLEAYSTRDELYSLLPAESIKKYVDAGAYNGDTVREAIEYFPSLEEVVAIEPDPKNFKKLSKYVDTLTAPKVKTVMAAAYSECKSGTFASSGNRNSSVNSTASYQHKTEQVQLVSVDSLVPQGTNYVKYDVEGAEREALLGTDKTIRDYAPTLLVSLYHRSRDIFSLVNYLSDTYPDTYKLYVRRLLCVPAWEIDLIACNK
ncbi:MAG: FkbM family methyltransferase [Clostridia bacterium]|nr:FkbM family methyltransferase [Clostridia bacterium]